MRDSNNINIGANDDIYDAVREARYLGRTNIGFVERGNASGNSVINASVRSTAAAKRWPRPAYRSS